MEEYKSKIITSVKDYIESIESVMNYHIEIKENMKTNSAWHVRPTLKIILWVKKDIFEAQEVMSELSGELTFEDHIKILLSGVMLPKFDIYYV